MKSEAVYQIVILGHGVRTHGGALEALVQKRADESCRPPFPQIMAGLNQTIMLSLSMVVIAALVGADGLGVPVVRALNRVNTALGFESGFIIVVVAIVLDRMLRVNRMTTEPRTAVEFDNVSIVFGDNPETRPAADGQRARPGRDRSWRPARSWACTTAP